MQFLGGGSEFLELVELNPTNAGLLSLSNHDGLRIFWNLSAGTRLQVDGIVHDLEPNEMFFLTELHQLKVLELQEGRLFHFNRPFYCLDNHDTAVGCKGLLFFGATNLPLVKIEAENLEIFGLLWRVFFAELNSKDNLQLEMLRMLLMRWIILCIRIYKRQQKIDDMAVSTVQLLREFNYLVEKHYRQIHDVKGYAALLNKSPKTLANLFSKYSDKTPLQVIQTRILLEAQRLLLYSDKSVKEIAYQLGFVDIQAFSRFFNTKMGFAATTFKETSLRAS